MALKDWVSGHVATATPATPATHSGDNGRTVATVATVAVAGSRNSGQVANREAREERAAILEFCAGYSRAEAERVARLIQ